MEAVIKELKEVVESFTQKFSQISDQDFSAKPNPTKWSRKEVVGHLIDSAINKALRPKIVGGSANN